MGNHFGRFGDDLSASSKACQPVPDVGVGLFNGGGVTFALRQIGFGNNLTKSGIIIRKHMLHRIVSGIELLEQLGYIPFVAGATKMSEHPVSLMFNHAPDPELVFFDCT